MVIIFILLVFTVGQFYLGGALSSKQVAVDQLTRQLNDLNQLFTREKATTGALRQGADSLSHQLQAATADRDGLISRLATTTEQLTSAQNRATSSEAALALANQTVATDRQQAQLTLDQAESLRRDIAQLTQAREALEARVATLTAQGDQSTKDLAALRDRSKTLDAQLSTAAEHTALAQKEIDSRDVRLRARDDQIGQLNQSIQGFRDQLTALTANLQASQDKNQQQGQQLAADSRLSGTLQDKVTTLQDQLDKLNGALKLALDKTSEQAGLLATSADQVNRLKAESDAKAAEATQLNQDSAALRAQLTHLTDALKTAQDKIAQQATEIAAVTGQAADARNQVSDRNAEVASTERNLSSLRDQIAQLNTALKTEQDTNAQQRTQMSSLTDQAARARGDADARQAALGALTLGMTGLRDQIVQLNAALKEASDKNTADQSTIAELNSSRGLAGKVEELAKFRSEFFGRLRTILGDRPDIHIVGDRFVFQSEVLFDAGSAGLNDKARQSLDPLVQAIRDLIPKMPNDINWVLQIDGHTDQRPMDSSKFPSNWELSAARAISVVKYLISQGIPADRLVAAGYGEFQPLDPGSSDAAMRRNRRIEVKLTER